MQLNDLLRSAVEAGASDIHLKFGRPPLMRRNGLVIPMENGEQLSNADLDGYLRTITSLVPNRYERFNASGTSTSHTRPRACRASA